MSGRKLSLIYPLMFKSFLFLCKRIFESKKDKKTNRPTSFLLNPLLLLELLCFSDVSFDLVSRQFLRTLDLRGAPSLATILYNLEEAVKLLQHKHLFH